MLSPKSLFAFVVLVPVLAVTAATDANCSVVNFAQIDE